MIAKNSHCSYCGTAFEEGAPWPRRCASCENTTYINPLPVAVLLVQIQDSLLLVERADRTGKYALPGGYINAGESWQQAAAREAWEETGVTIDAAHIRLFDTKSAPDGTLLVFGLASHPLIEQLSLPSEAATEIVTLRTGSYQEIMDGEISFAFPLHQEVALRWARESGNDAT